MFLSAFGAGKPLADSDPFWSSVQFLQGFNTLTDGTPVDATLPNAKAGGTVSFTTTANRWEISSTQSAGGGKSALATANQNTGQIAASVAISGQFTFESSIFISSSYDSVNQSVVQITTGTGNASFVTPSSGATNWKYNYPGLSLPVDFASFVTNQWSHFAVTRDASNLIRLFYNGTLIASYTDTASVSSLRSAFYSRVAGALANTFYNDEIRATVGVCRYTASYTPSFPFPTQ